MLFTSKWEAECTARRVIHQIANCSFIMAFKLPVGKDESVNASFKCKRHRWWWFVVERYRKQQWTWVGKGKIAFRKRFIAAEDDFVWDELKCTQQTDQVSVSFIRSFLLRVPNFKRCSNFLEELITFHPQCLCGIVRAQNNIFPSFTNSYGFNTSSFLRMCVWEMCLFLRNFFIQTIIAQAVHPPALKERKEVGTDFKRIQSKCWWMFCLPLRRGLSKFWAESKYRTV